MKDLGKDVADVFAGTEIIIHLNKDVKLDEKALKASLAKHKVKMKSVKKDAKYIL
ncbi:MAG: hypothetical protein AAF957_22965 [Planctomycetota bacterium]